MKVYFMAYRETLQERGLRLIAAKVRSALAVEGELIDEGLSAFQEDQDLFLQLARSIVGEEAVPDDSLEQWIARPPDADNGYLMPEGLDPVADDPVEEAEAASMPESDETGRLNGAGIHGNGMKEVRLPDEVPATLSGSPPVSVAPVDSGRETPLITRVENPEQLALF